MHGLHEKPLRTRIYVDGYNFYYGCLRGTAYKWLDLLTLFEKHILPAALLVDHEGRPRQSVLLGQPSLKFFTAKIIESVARSTDSVSSQARYHTALRKVHGGRIELIEGYYAVNKMRVRVVDPLLPEKQPRDCKQVQAWKVEEKQSDVNLALQAYHDAITGQVDHAVIVTNDTDIEPALRMIRDHTQVLIGLVVPTTDHTRQPNSGLAKLAHWKRSSINVEELAACQLPRVIQGRKPTVKPESWYGQPDLLRQIVELAASVRGGRAAAFKWMEQANPYLNNRRPIELAETPEGANQVLNYIQAWITIRKQSE